MPVIAPSTWVAIHIVIAMSILVTFALILRLIARFQTKSLGRPEEVLIGFAAFFFYATNATFLGAILNPYSSGSLELTDFTTDQILNFSKWAWPFDLLFLACLGATKLSILSFYKGIFPTRKFAMFANGVGFLCVANLITGFCLIIFQCTPVEEVWTLQGQLGGAQCRSIFTEDFYNELANVILDFAILSLPLFMIRQLRLPTRKKLAVSGVFLIGGFACFTGVTRMYWTYDPSTAAPRDLAQACYWVVFEMAVAIIAACLPTYAVLFKGNNVVLSKPRSIVSSLLNGLTSIRPSKVSQSSSAHYSNHSELDSTTGSIQQPTMEKVSGFKNDYDSGKYSLNNITVTREVELS